MTNQLDSQAPIFMDDPHAPDLFADGATGFFVLNGNMRITLEAARVSHDACPGPINRVVIGRLVLPLSAAEALAEDILAFIERQRSQASAGCVKAPR